MLLKGKLGPILRAIKAVVGAVLQGRGGDSLARRRCSRICGKIFLKLASN